jgi:hypothetical protein
MLHFGATMLRRSVWVNPDYFGNAERFHKLGQEKTAPPAVQAGDAVDYSFYCVASRRCSRWA